MFHKAKTEAIGLEAWFSVGASDATRSGVVGAFQQGEDYGKGWALMHWRDRNRGDVWFVSFFVAVEANDAAFADFSSWRSDPNSRGGLASVVARVTPAPALEAAPDERLFKKKLKAALGGKRKQSPDG